MMGADVSRYLSERSQSTSMNDLIEDREVSTLPQPSSTKLTPATDIDSRVPQNPRLARGLRYPAQSSHRAHAYPPRSDQTHLRSGAGCGAPSTSPCHPRGVLARANRAHHEPHHAPRDGSVLEPPRPVPGQGPVIRRRHRPTLPAVRFPSPPRPTRSRTLWFGIQAGRLPCCHSIRSAPDGCESGPASPLLGPVWFALMQTS